MPITPSRHFLPQKPTTGPTGTFDNPSSVTTNQGVVTKIGDSSASSVTPSGASGGGSSVTPSPPTSYTAVAPLFLIGLAFTITQSSAAQDGYLSSIDWNTFNGKADPPDNATIITNNGAIVATSDNITNCMNFL